MNKLEYQLVMHRSIASRQGAQVCIRNVDSIR